MNIFDRLYEKTRQRFLDIPTLEEFKKFIEFSIQCSPAYNDDAILKEINMHDVVIDGGKLLKKDGFRISSYESNDFAYFNDSILKTVDSVDVNISAMEEKGYAYTKK